MSGVKGGEWGVTPGDMQLSQHPEDGMVVLHLLTSMLQQLRYYVAWIDIITVY